MKKWTDYNLHEFNIEANNMGDKQTQIASWVESYIYDNATVITIDCMLAKADDYIPQACDALEWQSVPQCGGLEVNIW